MYPAPSTRSIAHPRWPTPRSTLGLDRLDLAISGTALEKSTSTTPRSSGDSTSSIRDATADRPWLEVVAVREQLIVDIAEGYDVVVMGADKWTQVIDPPLVRRRGRPDAALARLPQGRGGALAGHRVPPELALAVPEGLEHVSASAVRGSDRMGGAGRQWRGSHR